MTENSISALGAIATHVLADQDQSQLLRVWLGQLPLKEDESEGPSMKQINKNLLPSIAVKHDSDCTSHPTARIVHRQLCDLIEQGHPAIVGNQFDQLPVVLAVVAQIFELNIDRFDAADDSETLVDPSTSKRMVGIVQQIQQQMPGPVVQAAWGTLTDVQQTAVQRSLQRGY